MDEPQQIRDPQLLAPVFRYAFEAWMQTAQEQVPHVELRISETRRTLERQRWLYAQGREEPFLGKRVVTWTMSSRHRWGLAADWFIYRPRTREIEWGEASYLYVYKLTPPSLFGLRTLHGDLVHLEHIYASNMVTDAATLGLYRA